MCLKKSDREDWKNGCLTHVLQRSDWRAELLEEERVVGLCTAKVDDLDDIHVSDNDIFWLDVQVENASGMEVVQTLEDLRDVGHHVVLRVTEPENQRANAPLLGGAIPFVGAHIRARSVRLPHLSMRLNSSSFPLQYSEMSTK